MYTIIDPKNYQAYVAHKPIVCGECQLDDRAWPRAADFLILRLRPRKKHVSAFGLLVLRSSQIDGIGFGHSDYIRKSISTPNRHQSIGAHILKTDICLDGKRGLVIRMPNSKTYFTLSYFRVFVGSNNKVGNKVLFGAFLDQD
ncbi:hypothetical protein DVH24_034325 [Malus domestica]|uniref:Uncharacterized protein n=1 Tax=Malus domestica TaxID=3750 RepID=A0A498IYP4_MALDO|nr:hypothetical protein DVH24_034325 [Malus domestica]